MIQVGTPSNGCFTLATDERCILTNTLKFCGIVSHLRLEGRVQYLMVIIDGTSLSVWPTAGFRR